MNQFNCKIKDLNDGVNNIYDLLWTPVVCGSNKRVCLIND